MVKIRPTHLILGALLLVFVLKLFFTLVPIPFQQITPVMGTVLRVKVIGPKSYFWSARATYEIKRLEQLFSKYLENSEVSLINRLAGKAPVQVSSDTFKVLKLALYVNKLSKGAFDVTLGHANSLVLDENHRKVFLRKSGVSIDLGGVGKGYAIEFARGLLRKNGVKSAIIDMRSSIAVIGSGWRIGIKDPRDVRQGEEKEKILGTVVLNDGEALSTSGQYEQPGHIIDPRTNKPADKCLSVTVIAKDASVADALSTAVFVLGPEEGIRLIRRLGMKAIIVDKGGRIISNFKFEQLPGHSYLDLKY